jgi:predicted metal-dependent phosphoesterase TrpH
MTIDLHTHSAISDGTDTVPALVRAARAAGLTVIALTDHDTMAGVAGAQQEGRELGLAVLRGMELSTHVIQAGKRVSVHLLGYGCSPVEPVLAGWLAEVRQGRRTRVPRTLELLAGLGVELSEADVAAHAARATTLGRPHIADALVAKGYVADRAQAFRDYLAEDGPAYVAHPTPQLSQAVRLIDRAGGVAVLAHPWGRGTRNVLTPLAIANLVGSHGLFGLEADHVDHSEADRRELRQLAHELGLIVTGSSDYHGTGKTANPLGVFTTAAEVYQTITDAITERGGQL